MPGPLGIGSVGPVQRPDGAGIPLGGVAGRGGIGGAGGTSFADTLKMAVGDVSSLQDSAKDAIGAFVRGEDVELHEVMAATEEAGIALELLIEMRNKLTEAYRSVISMQS